MADLDAASDHLPSIDPRERADSTMSLGAGNPFSENGGSHANGAGSLASPMTAPAPIGDVTKHVQDVLTSEIGVATMLNRLKQSITSAKEFGVFLKKRSTIEHSLASDLKRLSNTTAESMRRTDHLGGSFSSAFNEMMMIHERMAENGMQFSLSLHQMHEDLFELAAYADKTRKGYKASGLSAEQRLAEVEAAMRKSQSKYHGLAEEYDRARTGDASTQKGGKMFGFKGPKSAAQHEEDLLRKLQAADQDYQTKVQVVQHEREELTTKTRPEAIKALQDMVRECDSGLVLQMQKFASFNEKLLLSNGLSISPLKGKKGIKPDSQSLREIVLAVDTQKDLNDYLSANHSKVPAKLGELKYERHPVLSSVIPTGPTMSGAHVHQMPPPQNMSAVPMSQPMGQPPGHVRQNSSQQLASPTNQPPYTQVPPPQNNQLGSDWARNPMTMLPPTQAGRPPSTGQGPQHERSFSSGSMLSQQAPPPPQQQRNSAGAGLHGTSNSRYNAGSISQQGPPQLGALSFQEPPQPTSQYQPPVNNSSPQQPYPPSGPQGSMGAAQGRGSSPPRIPNARPVFGVSLQRLYDRDGLAVPMVVYQCIQAVDLFGLTVEGIYRLSGSLPHVNKLKGMFDTDSSQPNLDFRNPENFFHDVNGVAGLLKQFFRDLPDPLLTKEHYSAFIEAAKNDDEIVRRDSLHAIINSLPDPNYATLRAISLHLHRVIENSAVNRMNCQNLAIVFGPTLMGSNVQGNIADAGWQCRVVDTILQNTYQIFDED